MDKETYRETLERQLRNGKVRVSCVICGEDDPSTLERHHIDGRMNSDRIVMVCKNCHAKITAEQNKIPPLDRSSSNSERMNEGFRRISHGAFYIVSGQHMIENGHRIIRDDKDRGSGIHPKGE